MRLSTLLAFGLFTVTALAQDDTAVDPSGDALDTADTGGDPAGDAAADGGVDTSGASGTAASVGAITSGSTSGTGILTTSNVGWNSSYFTYPTRTNYWVDGAWNEATWMPLAVETSLFLINADKTILPGWVAIATNLPSGTSSLNAINKGFISNITSSRNYMLVLSMSGNPDQKLAQSQGFYIKPKGTPTLTPQLSNSPDPASGGGSSDGSAGGVLAGTAPAGEPAADGSIPAANPTPASGAPVTVAIGPVLLPVSFLGLALQYFFS